MHLKNFFAVIVSATVVLIASNAMAQPTIQVPGPNVEVIDVTLSDGTDVKVNRLSIDFAGDFSGAQAFIELTSGSLYNNPAGGDTAPNEALFTALPDIEWDSFATVGGYTSGTQGGSPVLPGGAVNIDAASGNARIANDGVNFAWAPSGDNVPSDRMNYPIAQFTFTPDANGTLHLFATADNVGWNGVPLGQPGSVLQMPIIQGVIGVPEPSTFVLLGLGLVGLVALKRRNG